MIPKVPKVKKPKMERPKQDQPTTIGNDQIAQSTQQVTPSLSEANWQDVQPSNNTFDQMETANSLLAVSI